MNPNASSIYSLLRDYIDQEATCGTYQNLFISRLPPEPGKRETIYPDNYTEKTQLIMDTPKQEELQMPNDSNIKKSINEFAPPDGTNADKLQALVNHIEDCQLCRVLAASRNKIVFGSGNPNAKIMFVGEGPGRDEDIQGIPFVGRAGKLLMDIIQKGMKLNREDVYIANILKCRPPQNRNPKPDEEANCTPFLNSQLEIIKPKVIVALGLYAAQFLTGQKIAIGKLRGQFHEYKGIPVMPTYHPAYLLRNYSKDNRMKVWEDIKKVMEFLKK